MWVFTNSINTVREKIHLRAWERHSCSVPHPWVQPAVRRHIPSRQTYTEHVYTPHPCEYTHPATWIKQTPRALTWTHSVLRASSCSPLILKSHNKSYFIPKCIPPASIMHPHSWAATHPSLWNVIWRLFKVTCGHSGMFYHITYHTCLRKRKKKKKLFF